MRYGVDINIYYHISHKITVTLFANSFLLRDWHDLLRKQAIKILMRYCRYILSPIPGSNCHRFVLGCRRNVAHCQDSPIMRS